MKYVTGILILSILYVLIGCAPDNNPPEAPSVIYPPDGDSTIYIDISLYWTSSDVDNNPLIYDVYFGTTNPPPRIQSGIQVAEFDPGVLQYDTEYFWKIDVMDKSEKTEGAIWHFETMSATENYHKYYLATGSYSSIEGNYSDPDPEHGAPWIALSSHGSYGAKAQWQFQGYSKAVIETLVIGAYSHDNGWDFTGGEHYNLFNFETQEWDCIFDSDQSKKWHYAQITGASAKPYVNDTTNIVILELESGYTDHSHIREVFCTQADLDTTRAVESTPGTITVIGGMRTDNGCACD